MKPPSDNIELTDLSTCDREPIHVPGSIQPFGYLLVVNIQNKKICQYSTNLLEKLPDLNNIPLQEIIDSESFKKFNDIIQFLQPNERSEPFTIHFTHLPDTVFWGIVHIWHEFFIIDIEPKEDIDIQLNQLLNQVYHVLHLLQKTKNIHEIADLTATHIKEITSYDRVMVYQFDDKWNGEVIAESKESYLNSFLGLHFPATDIPVQARKLYTINLTRIITDINYRPSPLFPHLPGNTSTDLSLSTLRSVSPIHVEYLQNMGVQATLVISLIVDNKLWGLIACHHYQPKFIDYRLRISIERLASIVSHEINFLLNNQKQREIFASQKVSLKIIKSISKDRNPFDGLKKNIDLLAQVITCCGVVIVQEEQYFKYGNTPDTSFINQIVSFLQTQDFENILYTGKLSDWIPSAVDYTYAAAGMMAIRTSSYSHNYVIWFREEQIQQVSWAGNPEKNISTTVDNGKIRLSPRQSFEKWVQDMRLSSLPWKTFEIEATLQFRRDFLELIAIHSERLHQQKIMLQKIVAERTQALLDSYKELNTASKRTAKLYEQTLKQNEMLTQIAFLQSHKVRAPVATALGLINIIKMTEPTDITFSNLIEKLEQTILEMDTITREIVSKTIQQ